MTSRNSWFLGFAAATLLTPPIALGFAGGNLHLAMLFGVIGLSAGIVWRDAWRTRLDPLAVASVATVAVFAASCVPALIYSGPSVAVGSLVRSALFGLAVYAFLYFRDGPGAACDPTPILRWMLRLAALSALFGCLDFYYHWDPLAPFADQFVWSLSLRRAQGFFYEAGQFGNFCAFFLVGVAALWSPRGRSVLSPLLAVILTPALAAGLAFSFSRSSILNLVVGLVTLAALSLRSSGGKRLVGVFAAVLVLAGIVYFIAPTVSLHAADRIVGTIAQAFTQPTVLLGERLESWKLIVGFLSDHPWRLALGIGYKTLAHSEVLGQRVVADNTFLSLLAETGLVGLAAVVYMLAAVLRTAYQAARSADDAIAALGLWSFAFWCGQLVQMLLVDSLTYWRVLPLYLVVLALAARDADPRPRSVR